VATAVELPFYAHLHDSAETFVGEDTDTNAGLGKLTSK
jgi:hypothetical protein